MRNTATVVPLRQPPFSGKLPKKPENKDVRSREYLTEKEVNELMTAAKKIGRHGHRDSHTYPSRISARFSSLGTGVA